MLTQAEPLEQRDGVGCKNVARRSARIDCEQNGDQAAHDMGVTVADERQHRTALAIGLNARRQPDLTGTTLHLVGIAPVALVERRQRSAELDDIAVAVVPLVQQGKILDDLVCRHGLASARSGGLPYLPSI